jgi:hypothetical protein
MYISVIQHGGLEKVSKGGRIIQVFDLWENNPFGCRELCNRKHS